ncbi:unnamed protein product [Colias eurytheme]|nr:unnamed protein product [Colias eurytheme]
MQTDITSVLVFIIFISLCDSSILRINNLPDLKLVEALIANFNNEQPNLFIIAQHKNRETDPEERNQNENLHNFNRKKKLIRKIVPHTEDEGKIEYDYKLNAFYKPILRIHKKRLNFEENNNDNAYENLFQGNKLNKDEVINIAQNVYKELEEKYDIIDSAEEDVVFRNDNLNVGSITNHQNFEPVNPHFDELNDGEIRITKQVNKNKQRPKYNNVNNNEVLQQLELLIDIYHHLNKIHSRSRKLKSYGKIMPTLKKIDSLRAHFDKSGEDNDPLAPGNELGEDKPQKETKTWMPYYPPWNYWSYKKTIHQDICPGNQIRVDHMCIWMQPH